jgi:hypothetical protein
MLTSRPDHDRIPHALITVISTQGRPVAYAHSHLENGYTEDQSRKHYFAIWLDNWPKRNRRSQRI